MAEVGAALADEIELAAVVRPYQLENLRSLFPNLHDMINDYGLGLSSDDFAAVDGLSTPDTKLFPLVRTRRLAVYSYFTLSALTLVYVYTPYDVPVLCTFQASTIRLI